MNCLICHGNQDKSFMWRVLGLQQRTWSPIRTAHYSPPSLVDQASIIADLTSNQDYPHERSIYTSLQLARG